MPSTAHTTAIQVRVAMCSRRNSQLITATHAGIEAMITPAERTRITGFGVAAPFELWSWAREVGALTVLDA